MKAIVNCFGDDADPGATANEFMLFAKVTYVGTEVEIPGRVVNGMGADGRGVPVAVNITALAQYPNAVEDALIAEHARLMATGQINTGTTLARTDCLFPSYTRGA